MKSDSPVNLEQDGALAIIKVNNPKVNALSTPVRIGLIEAISKANQLQSSLILIWCEGTTFFSGADIKEFDQPPITPTLPETIEACNNSNAPILSAMHGTTLGGGFEVALSSSYRIASANTMMGFPEVNLGIIPGSGGTQLITRFVNLAAAIDMICLDKRVKAEQALAHGIIDKICKGDDYYQEAVAYGHELIKHNSQSKHTMQLPITPEDNQQQVIADKTALIKKKYPGHQARLRAVDCILLGYNTNSKEALQKERQEFLDLKESKQAQALRHVFFLERSLPKPQTKVGNTLRISVIGAGTMGKNIVYACANAGLPTTLIDLNQEILEASKQYHSATVEQLEKKGILNAKRAKNIIENITYATTLKAASNSDVIIEAIIESVEAKSSVFKQLSNIAPKAIIASNTSYLDLYSLSKHLTNRQNFLGMHFFNPAHRMKLLEIITLNETQQTALDTALHLAKLLKKIPILAGHCFGFAANRLYTAYNRANSLMLLEGTDIATMDSAFKDFGMAMGPLQVLDSSGIDIGHQGRGQNPNPPSDPTFFQAIASLAENKLYGKKTNQGFYLYENGKAVGPNPRAQELILQKAKELGVEQKPTQFNDIVAKAFGSVVKEGQLMLQENSISSMGEIDLIWVYGYGFPRHLGGPAFHFIPQTS